MGRVVMREAPTWRRYLRLFGTDVHADVEDELSFHLEMRTQELIDDGWAPGDARAEAIRLFGDRAAVTVECQEIGQARERTTRRVRLLENLAQDVRLGLRRLLKRPAFTTLAVLLMTLGIGSTTTVFSVLRKILLEPIPYHEPDRLYRMWQRDDARGWNFSSFSEPNYIGVRDGNTTLESMGAYTVSSGVLTGRGDPVQLRLARASASLFTVLGVQPALGRNFLATEDADGGESEVVLLTHDFWRSQFGEDPGVLGRGLTIDGRSRTVVGVLPPGEDWLEWYDAYVPLNPAPAGDRGNNILWAFGRLRPGVTEEQARADMDSLAKRIAQEFPEDNTISGVSLRRLDRYLIGGAVRTTLWMLMGSVGFVLLIACANLANMTLAQVTGRHRELAVSSALGAGRGRLVRQLLTESTLLAMIGGLSGLLLARWLVSLLRAFDPGGIPRLQHVTVNGWVAAFTLGLTLVVGLLAGITPALRGPRINMADTLKEGARSMGGRRRDRVRTALVVVEMALSVLLLTGAGLMIRSFLQLQQVERGFEADNRLLFDLTLPDPRYDDREVLGSFLGSLFERLEAVPGVNSAGAVSAAPIEGLNTNMGIHAEGHPPAPGEPTSLADWRMVTPGYFKALGVPLLRGRSFADMSTSEAAPLLDEENDRFVLNVVINQALAQAMWPDEDPIGKRAVLWSNENTMGTVIGVVGDMRERGLETDARSAVYLSYTVTLWNPVTVAVHTTTEPTAVVPAVRTILHDLDPDIPIANVRTMDELLTGSLRTRRFVTYLLVAFALVALVLACAGIYGVMSRSVAERVGEVAVRVSLGASPGRVIRMVTTQGMWRALLGTAIGLAAALSLSRFIRSMLFGVGAGDAVTYLLVTLVLAATALLACLIPARRMLRIDPATLLRSQ